MPVRVRDAASFRRAMKRLHRDVQRQSVEALVRFVEDPGRPSLNFEQVTGKSGFFSVRVNRAIRILLRRDEDPDGPMYTAVDIGNHDRIYR